jgi:hypothetical protein
VRAFLRRELILFLLFLPLYGFFSSHHESLHTS